MRIRALALTRVRRLRSRILRAVLHIWSMTVDRKRPSAKGRGYHRKTSFFYSCSTDYTSGKNFGFLFYSRVLIARDRNYFFNARSHHVRGVAWRTGAATGGKRRQRCGKFEHIFVWLRFSRPPLDRHTSVRGSLSLWQWPALVFAPAALNASRRSRTLTSPNWGKLPRKRKLCSEEVRKELRLSRTPVFEPFKRLEPAEEDLGRRLAACETHSSRRVSEPNRQRTCQISRQNPFEPKIIENGRWRWRFKYRPRSGFVRQSNYSWRIPGVRCKNEKAIDKGLNSARRKMQKSANLSSKTRCDRFFWRSAGVGNCPRSRSTRRSWT